MGERSPLRSKVPGVKGVGPYFCCFDSLETFHKDGQRTPQVFFFLVFFYKKTEAPTKVDQK